MANGSPFFIDPAASRGFAQGLGAVGSAFLKKQQMDEQAAQQAAAQQEIQGALQSGDVNQIQQVMLKYPQMAQTIEQSFGFSSEQSKQDMLSRAFNILGGANGTEELGPRAQQLEANGLDATQTREGMAMEPEQLRQTALMTIATLGSPEQIKFAERYTGGDAMSPYQSAQLDLERQKLTMRQLENDQRKLDRDLAKETNEIKRRQLLQELEANRQKMESAKREQLQTAQDAVATVDTTLDSIQRVLTHPGLDAAVGLTSVFPTIPGSQAANFEEQLESLKSQAFLSEVEKMRGLGALTEREGARLENALGALSLRQSEDAFRKELRRVRDIMNAAKKRAEGRVPQAADLPEPLPGATPGPGTLAVEEGAGAQEGSIAVNPATGERIILRGGQWVPLGG